MRAVWEFTLDRYAKGETLEMPEGAQILHVQALTFWALVDTDAPRVPRSFAIFATGETLPPFPVAYLGTFFEWPFVWHVFELFESDVPDDLDPARHDDFRRLVNAGYRLGEPVGDPAQPATPKLRPWVAPCRGEPVDPMIYAAVANLQDHGYGPIVGGE